MFKSFFNRNVKSADQPPKCGRPRASHSAFPGCRGTGGFLLGMLCAVSAASGCRHISPLEPTNLAEPGWTIRRGQAVWRPKQGEPELVGNVIVASNVSGEDFIRFSKDPLEMVVARRSPSGWQLDLAAFGKSYSGRGRPPKRVLWFQLADAVFGELERGSWNWWTATPDKWILENRATGERLEGFFRP